MQGEKMKISDIHIRDPFVLVEEEKYYLNIAKENNLLVSAGSDCHGNFVDDYRHGDIGSMNYPSLYLEKFLDALNIKKAEAK